VIGILDYRGGNITSVANALEIAGAEFLHSSDPRRLRTCQGVIFPGVGAAPGTMMALAERRACVPFLLWTRRPVLGICLGMQVLYESSDEGNTDCLAILPGRVRRLGPPVKKIPHMGWNSVRYVRDGPLTEGIPQDSQFYFAHSYAAPVSSMTTGVTDCGVEFSAAVQYGNYYGVQFHPEKSGEAGIRLLRNFVSLCSSYRP
jgi:glutamine amidotransferase